MKIATNVTREYLGGITRSNVSLLDFLNGKSDVVIGIELNARRYMMGPRIFQHLPPDWFRHHIVNIHDISLRDAIDSSKSIKDLERFYRPVINIVKDILRKEKPDVVFLNGTYYIPWIISIAAHELRIPIVLRYAGVYSKETENSKPHPRKLFNDIEKSFQKRSSHVIFPSRLCKDVVEREVLKKNIKNSSIIPNPVSLHLKQKIVSGVEGRIAAVGRWDRIKNFESFFGIHKFLLKTGWRHEAVLVTGETRIPRFPKTINRLAPMTHEELIRFYSSQGLIISPSFFETFGNVPMEAVSLGIPVLVSDNMGCAEVLKMAGLEDMVISFEDPKNVAERVKLLCGKPVPRKKVNNIRKTLDPKVINAEIMSVIRSVAGV